METTNRQIKAIKKTMDVAVRIEVSPIPRWSVKQYKKLVQ